LVTQAFNRRRSISLSLSLRVRISAVRRRLSLRETGGAEKQKTPLGPCHRAPVLAALPPVLQNGQNLERQEIDRRLTAQELAQPDGVAPLAQHGEIGRGRSRGDVVTSIERGNSAAYLVARLKRDAPEIAERLADNPSADRPSHPPSDR
jgi:hypothetical protein